MVWTEVVREGFLEEGAKMWHLSPGILQKGSAHSSILLQCAFDLVSTSEGIIAGKFLSGLGKASVGTAAE